MVVALLRQYMSGSANRAKTGTERTYEGSLLYLSQTYAMPVRKDLHLGWLFGNSILNWSTSSWILHPRRHSRRIHIICAMLQVLTPTMMLLADAKMVQDIPQGHCEGQNR
jgi:hypothetical protein